MRRRSYSRRYGLPRRSNARRRALPSPWHIRPRLEVLEDRRVLSTASHLVFGQQPTSSPVTDVIQPAVTVEVRDQLNNLVTTADDPITVSISNNPSGGALGGTVVATPVNGVATFDDLSIDNVGSDYTLVASAPQFNVPTIGLSIEGVDGGEIPVLGYQWGESAQGGQVSVADFQLTVDSTTADPGFLAAVALGQRYNAARLHVRTDDVTRAEYLTYNFEDVVFNSWQTNGLADSLPNGSVGFSFGAIEQRQREVQFDGTLGPDVIASYDVGKKVATGDLVFPPTTGPTEISMSIPADLNTAGGEIEVISYTFGEQRAFDFEPSAGPMAGPLSVSTFDLTLPSSTASPGFLAAVASATVFPKVEIHVRELGQQPLEFLTYTLEDVVFTYWQESLNSEIPQGNLSLEFAKITHEQAPILPDRTLGPAVTGEVDVVAEEGKGSLVFPQPTGLPEIGFSVEGVSLGVELPVLSYNWSEFREVDQLGRPQEAIAGSFQLALDTSVADPGFLAAIATDPLFPSATLHVRTMVEDSLQEYLTYSFPDGIALTSWQTSAFTGAPPQGHLSFDFRTIEQAQRGFNEQGELGAPVKAEYDFVDKLGDGDLEFPQTTNVPEIGLALTSLGRELSVLSYSWGLSNGASIPEGQAGGASFDELHLVVESSTADPGILFETAQGAADNLVFLNVRQESRGKLTQFLKFELTYASFVHWTTYATAGQPPQGELLLQFPKARQEVCNLDLSSTCGSNEVTAEYDLRASKGSGEMVFPEPLSLPEIGLSIPEFKGGNELPLENFSWSEHNPVTGHSSGGVTAAEFVVYMPHSGADAGFMLAVAQARVFETVEVHVRTSGSQRLEFLTYTLSDVVFTRWSTSGQPDSVPMGSLSMSFGKIRQERRPIDGLGELGPPVVGEYDFVGDKGNGTLEFPKPTGVPTVGLSVSGVSGGDELPVRFYSWSEFRSSMSAPQLGSFTLSLDSSIADPGFLAVVAQGKAFANATLHVRTPGIERLEYLTYILDEVVFTLWQTSASGGAANVGLGFRKIRQVQRPVNSDGTLGAAIVGEYDVQEEKGKGDIVGPSFGGDSVVSQSFTIFTPTPNLTGITPDVVVEGHGALSLTAQGTGFVAGSVVHFAGVPLSTSFVDSTQLMADVPANLLEDQSVAGVTVVSPGPGGGTSTAKTFTVNNAPPVATLAGPDTGVPGQPRLFTMQASDPSPVDEVAGFTFKVDWGDGSPLENVASTSTLDLEHTYAAPRLGPDDQPLPYTVKVVAIDKDGLPGAAVTHNILIRTSELREGTLVVGATDGTDSVMIRPADEAGNVIVRVNGVIAGTYQPSDLIVIFGQEGTDKIRLVPRRIAGGGSLQYITVPVIMHGGPGPDLLDVRGSTADNVVFGGDGNDVLRGGRGRDILIGGAGSDRTQAGTGGSILIGGATDHDVSNPLVEEQDFTPWLALLQEWGRTDLGGTPDQQYTRRVDHLLGPGAGGDAGGFNAPFFLNPETTDDDEERDVLFGNQEALDWFLTDALSLDKVKRRDPTELVTFPDSGETF